MYGEFSAGTGSVSDAGFAAGAAEDRRPGYDAGVPRHRNGYGARRAAPAGREAATTAGKAQGGAAFASVVASVDETRALVGHWLATSRSVDYSPGSRFREATDRAVSRAKGAPPSGAYQPGGASRCGVVGIRDSVEWYRFDVGAERRSAASAATNRRIRYVGHRRCAHFCHALAGICCAMDAGLKRWGLKRFLSKPTETSLSRTTRCHLALQ